MSAQSFRQTPSQTVGPFFGYGLTSAQYQYPFPQISSDRLADADCPGEHIRITGQVFDGAGEPINDAMIEIVQSDASGNFSVGLHDSFRSFGRSGTGVDAGKHFIFHTVKPTYQEADLAPHIAVAVFMRGLLTHCHTRLYFSDETEANAKDRTLLSIAAERRRTLVAERTLKDGFINYRFDIHMQGKQETVFLDV